MIQLFDTHRLPYPNATLQAFSNIEKTTRLNFYNITDASSELSDDDIVGDTIYTNAKGFICYDNGGSGREIATCIVLRQSAIIVCHYNDGTDRTVQWIVSGTNQIVKPTDVHKLKYPAGSGTWQTWDPLNNDVQLPEYVLKNELDTGNVWQEQTLTVEQHDAMIKPSQWTSIIIIPQFPRLPDTDYALTLDTVNLRAGQKIAVICSSRIDLTINDVRYKLQPGTTYLIAFASADDIRLVSLNDRTDVCPERTWRVIPHMIWPTKTGLLEGINYNDLLGNLNHIEIDDTNIEYSGETAYNFVIIAPPNLELGAEFMLDAKTLKDGRTQTVNLYIGTPLEYLRYRLGEVSETQLSDPDYLSVFRLYNTRIITHKEIVGTV